MAVLSAADREFWEENGYVVVGDAVPRENLDTLIDEVWDFLGMDRDDQSDWYREPHRNSVARDSLKRGMGRLEEGMEQNIRLVIAKAVVTLVHGGADHNDIARAGALYGVRRRREGWASGLTILSAMANVADHLQGEERIAPYYQGLVHVASDCAGCPPRIALRPLESADIELDSLQRWFRDLVEVCNPDGAERCLLTAISNGATAPQLAEMMIAAATDHFYLDGGHVVDFVNKAFEMLDRIGWDLAGEILPSLVRHMCRAQRSEELNAWRSPVDLVSPLKEAFESTPELLREGEGGSWQRPEGLVELLLRDDPHAIVVALNEAVGQGARPVQLAAAVTYASALRVARFHVQNEFPDWIGVLHTFTYNNALHQLLKRSESTAMLRGVYHGAMRVYLDRFLNIPPGEAARLNRAGGGEQRQARPTAARTPRPAESAAAGGRGRAIGVRLPAGRRGRGRAVPHADRISAKGGCGIPQLSGAGGGHAPVRGGGGGRRGKAGGRGGGGEIPGRARADAAGNAADAADRPEAAPRRAGVRGGVSE